MSAEEKSDNKSLQQLSDSHLEDGDSGSYDFGGESSLPPPPTLTPEEERRLWRRIDLRLVPILSLMYLLSFLDRGNARLQGLETQLNLTGNKYNIALVLVLKRFRPSRTLMGLVKTYPQLVGVRICLGVAEAGLFPLTLWYPRHMLQWRIGLFFGAASLAGAFGGLLAYGISFMSGTRAMLGWSWIFILEGIATVVVGCLAFFILVDFPISATFLTPEERSFVIWRKSKCPFNRVQYDNSSVGEEEHFEMRHLVQALLDWQVWLHMMIYMSIITNLYGITLFLPFGHSPAISNLLTVPPYVSFSTQLSDRSIHFAYYSDRMQKRYPFIIAGFLMCLTGYSINISNAPSGVKYFGTFFCVTGAYAAVPGIIAWAGNNLSGQYKRAVGWRFRLGSGISGTGAFASNIYRSQDKPHFIVGHACELMFAGIGLICVPTVALIYKRINSRREKAVRAALERGDKDLYPKKLLREMGDRAPDFKYIL
ncbi:major facilitator superfamily domain-containing protein [Mycena sp. CBHHK59/15]|nr:major facilitator superfamily domain-containing protein [Mycena sp. CBHHK59/15]